MGVVRRPFKDHAVSRSVPAFSACSCKDPWSARDREITGAFSDLSWTAHVHSFADPQGYVGTYQIPPLATPFPRYLFKIFWLIWCFPESYYSPGQLRYWPSLIVCSRDNNCFWQCPWTRGFSLELQIRSVLLPCRSAERAGWKQPVWQWRRSHHCHPRFSSFSWTNVFQFVICLWLISRVLKWLVLTILSNVIVAFIEIGFTEVLLTPLPPLNLKRSCCPVISDSSYKEIGRQGKESPFWLEKLTLIVRRR